MQSAMHLPTELHLLMLMCGPVIAFSEIGGGTANLSEIVLWTLRSLLSRMIVAASTHEGPEGPLACAKAEPLDSFEHVASYM